jgi:GNAT superfamily N-acetyltransferase
MIKVVSYEQLLGQIEIVKARRQGYLTNFYLDKNKVELWASHHLLYYTVSGDTLFLVKEEETFRSLYYCSTTLERLDTDLAGLIAQVHTKDIVVDLLGNEVSVVQVNTLFLNQSFKPYANLRRMVRIHKDEDHQEQVGVFFAAKDETIAVKKLLDQYFDPRCEQIPLVEELENLAGNQNILLCKEDGVITGFLIYTLTGATAYLRYWFTHPDYREQKTGSRLFRQFAWETRTAQRTLFWVMEDNENAIKRYIHYGFAPENMYDKVLISKTQKEYN